MPAACAAPAAAAAPPAAAPAVAGPDALTAPAGPPAMPAPPPGTSPRPPAGTPPGSARRPEDRALPTPRPRAQLSCRNLAHLLHLLGAEPGAQGSGADPLLLPPQFFPFPLQSLPLGRQLVLLGPELTCPDLQLCLLLEVAKPSLLCPQELNWALLRVRGAPGPPASLLWLHLILILGEGGGGRGSQNQSGRPRAMPQCCPHPWAQLL